MADVGTPWAHSANPEGHRHPLTQHLYDTAALASAFGARFGADRAAWYAGLWHDLGKFSCSWQEYLARREAGRPADRVDHKTAGAALAAHRQQTAAAFAIFGHHSGLPAERELRARVAAGPSSEVLEAAERAGVALDLDPRATLPEHAARNRLGLETFVRMLSSALVDADFLDTARHFSCRPATSTMLAWTDLAARFEERVVEMLAERPPSPVDLDRSAVRDDCKRRATQPQGMFRLHVPTGGGKTIAAMSFGAHHAAFHRLERVIVAVPFRSITEQNAAVYRRLLDDPGDPSPSVLEHHSGVLDPPDDWWRRLAAENWDAPAVVTTTVQLFESLFADRPSALRKLHRIAGSVLVLDEVQALPLHVLSQILDMLRRLVDDYGVTVVLSSATQPEFWALPQFGDLPVSDLVDAPARLAERLRRVRWGWRREPLSWPEVARELAERPQVLTVVNTVADAEALTNELRETSDVHHLTTRLCGAHRRWVLDDVRRRLAAGDDCRVVSTQLVEAGVDLDFPEVWRAMGPADSLLQAAGRCNREGRLAAGAVVIFDPADGHLPRGAYRSATERAAMLFGPELADPDELTDLALYYRELYAALRVEDDKRRVAEARERLDFPEVACRFRLIEEPKVSVIVVPSVSELSAPWIEPESLRSAAQVLEEIRSGRPLWTPQELRLLQPFTVDLHAGQTARGGADATEIAKGLWVWQGAYDPHLGVTTSLEPEDFVV